MAHWYYSQIGSESTAKAQEGIKWNTARISHWFGRNIPRRPGCDADWHLQHDSYHLGHAKYDPASMDPGDWPWVLRKESRASVSRVGFRGFSIVGFWKQNERHWAHSLTTRVTTRYSKTGIHERTEAMFKDDRMTGCGMWRWHTKQVQFKAHHIPFAFSLI